jgi:hypothetical protein
MKVPGHIFIRCMLLICILSSTALWVLKLYTAQYSDAEMGITGITWRRAPSLNNRVHPGEGSTEPVAEDGAFLITGNELGYLGDSYYLWMMDYGYACSTALTVLVLPLALKRRR